MLFHQRVPSVSADLRGRLLLLALLVVAGSPLVQRLRLNYYFEYSSEHPHDGSWAKFLLLAAGVPSWDSSPRFFGGVAYMASNDLWILLVYAGIVCLPSWLPARVPGWLRRVIGGVLAPELANLLWWAAPVLFMPRAEAKIWFFDELLVASMCSGLIFGLVAGGLLALLSAGSAEQDVATSTDTARASRIARRKESSA